MFTKIFTIKISFYWAGKLTEFSSFEIQHKLTCANNTFCWFAFATLSVTAEKNIYNNFENYVQNIKNKTNMYLILDYFQTVFQWIFGLNFELAFAVVPKTHSNA